MPRGTKAPKLWPAEPENCSEIVLSGRPAAPYRRVTSYPSIVPTVRFTFRIGSRSATGMPRSSAFAHCAMQLVVERAGQAVILPGRAPARCVRRHRRLMQNRGVIEPLRLPVVDRRPEVQPVDAADHLVHRAEAERGHVLAHFLRHEPEEVLHEFGLAGEVLAELRILRGHANRTGVQVTDAHHHAARDHQRRGRESEFLGPHQRGNDDVAAGFELPVDLDDDPVAQAVEHQHLLRLRQTELPRDAAVLDAGQRGGAGATVVSRDQHHIGVRLRHARGDRADASRRDQLHVNARIRIGILEIVNQLRQILD